MADSQNTIGGSALKPHKTYNYANNTAFYYAIPQPYWQYYHHSVREWFKWYDGYVDWFHTVGNQEGVFSTRIAKTIVDKLAKQITGGRLLFDDPDEDDSETVNIWDKDRNALDFSKTWSKKYKVDTIITKAVKMALAGGDSVLKINNLKGGKLYPTAVRKDNFFLDIDPEGKVIKYTDLIYDFSEQVKDKNNSQKQEFYYVMEERRYGDNGKPLHRLSLKRGTAKGVSYKDVDFHSADLDFKDLSKGQRDRVKAMFPDVMFNDWKELPLKDIGVYQIKASEGVSFNPALPFGESVLSDMIHLLMSYDFYYSAKMTDMYLGRGQVMLPEGIENPEFSGNYYDIFKRLGYERIPYKNPEEQTPISIQFDVRGRDWIEVRDNLMQEMAFKIGINPRSLATFIVPSSEKPSAHEISTDEDETALWVENKRDLVEPAINAMMEAVLDFYEFKDSVVGIKFSQKGLTNMNTLVNRVTQLKQNGLIDNETAIDMLYPDKSESQKQKILKALDNKDKEKTQQAPPDGKTVEEKQEDGFRNGESQVSKPENVPGS